MAKWHEISRSTKALWIASTAAWCSFAASVLTMGWIETTALSQPPLDDYTMYRHAHWIKGGFRFFTDQQESIYVIAKPLMFGTLILCGLFAWLIQRDSPRMPRSQSLVANKPGAN